MEFFFKRINIFVPKFTEIFFPSNPNHHRIENFDKLQLDNIINYSLSRVC